MIKTNWIAPQSKAEISFLWESKANNGLKGIFIKLPIGFNGQLKSDGKIVHSIVISGEIDYELTTDR